MRTHPRTAQHKCVRANVTKFEGVAQYGYKWELSDSHRVESPK